MQFDRPGVRTYVQCWQGNRLRNLYGLPRSGVHLSVHGGTLETAKGVLNLGGVLYFEYIASGWLVEL